MRAPTTVTGRELYALLPNVYRVRDERGHLCDYLDACGAVLDRLRATLEQRLADAFPSRPTGERPSQSWLLPYFADLLDVHLVSPLVEGRRAEVTNAIAWHQRKGTLPVLEQIAEMVGGLEVEVQEGWRRVAMTPRVDRPWLPASVFGEPEEPDPRNPLTAGHHSALAAVTVDVTAPSRAVVAEPSDPRAKVSRFGGNPVWWRQANPHGVPCFPGSFEDASRRVPDVRAPRPSEGGVHPRRLLLFVPPGTGFFPPDAVEVPWSDRIQHPSRIADQLADGDLPRVIRNPSPMTSVVITGSPDAFSDQHLVIEDLVFPGTLHLPDGRIQLRRVAAKQMIVDSAGLDTPVVDAADCLFDEIKAPNGLVRLEATTVMHHLSCVRLEASDCLFGGEIVLQPVIQDGPSDNDNDPGASCVRFSRVPPPLLSLERTRVECHAVTAAPPIFSAFKHSARVRGPRPVDQFGDPGYGVLHPNTPDAIRFGAEDGGEMGAGHHRATCLAHAAVLAKVEEFLPLGIEAALVPDPRLLVKPPAVQPPGRTTS